MELVLLPDLLVCRPELAETIVAFESPNRGRAGVMSNGRAYFFNPLTTKHTTRSEFSLAPEPTGRPAAGRRSRPSWWPI